MAVYKATVAEKIQMKKGGKEDMSEVKSPVLKTENLTIQFGGLVAVDKLNLEICEGDIYGLIGPNGAGKTTVFNMVMGYYQPTSGTIRFQGENIVGLSVDRVVKKGISRTFQNIRLFTELDSIGERAVRHACEAGLQFHTKYVGPESLCGEREGYGRKGGSAAYGSGSGRQIV